MKKCGILIVLGFFSVLASAQQNINHTLNHNNKTREYIVHTPTGYDTTQSLPLVVCLHGMSGNMTQQMYYSDFNTVSDTGNFIVVYPQGLVATTTWGVTTTQWDAYFGSGTKDLEFLDTLIDRMYYDYNIDLKRVYSTGMSNGGFMSYRLACELSDRIAGIASVTGAMAFAQENNCNPSHPMPVLQIHGTADGTVPYDGNNLFHSSIPDLVDFWRSKNNCAMDCVYVDVPDINTADSCTAWYKHYQTCDSGSSVLFYTIEGGEHTWPGASFSAGVTNQDFEAQSVIWNFFRQYQLNNPVMPEPEPEPEDTVASTGIRMLEQHIRAIPNPFDEKLNIQLIATSSAYTDISIHNALGQPVFRQLSFDEVISVNTAEWPVGIYMVYVNGRFAQKVVKRE